MSADIEYRAVIWGEGGESVQFTQDGDGLGLFEVRNVDGRGHITERVTLTPRQARFLADAMQFVLSAPEQEPTP